MHAVGVMLREAKLSGCRIGHLTVVAGPKAVGKSHFIRLLFADEALRRRVGVPVDAEVWTDRTLARGSPRPREIEHLVLHYDLLRLYDRGVSRYERDLATSILGCADQITFLTLRTTREHLCAQFDRRLHRKKGRRKLEHLQRLRTLYEDEDFLHDWYRRWLRFVDRWADVTVGSYFVDVHESYELKPAVRTGLGF